MTTLEERISVLDEEVSRLIERGWTVEVRTDTTCMLFKKNNYQWIMTILVFLWAWVPSYGGHMTTRIIEVTPEGLIKRTRSVL